MAQMAAVLEHHEEIDDTRFNQTPIDESESGLCRTIWIAVIAQAVIDASGKNCSKLDQAQALRWLKANAEGRSDFADVCDLAGIDFRSTRERCLELVRTRGMDFRCLKKPEVANRENESRSRYYKRVERNARLREERRLKSQPFLDASNDNLRAPANDNINQPKGTIYE